MKYWKLVNKNSTLFVTQDKTFKEYATSFTLIHFES